MAGFPHELHEPLVVEIDDEIFAKYGRNPEGLGRNHGDYLAGVVTALRTNKAALVDGWEGRKSLELITAIYESIETNVDVPLRFRARKCRLGMAS